MPTAIPPLAISRARHFESAQMARDRQRDEWFAEQGFKTIRFNTGELTEGFEGCIEIILQTLGLNEEVRLA